VKAYIAAPFSSMTEPVNDERLYGELKDIAYIGFPEGIENVVKECGFETFLPHRDLNKWGRVYIEPSATVSGCYMAISSCDIFIAYPGKSRGVHVEMGWASSFKKRLILLIPMGEKPSLIISGLNAVARTEVVEFKDAEDMKTKLRTVLKRT